VADAFLREAELLMSSEIDVAVPRRATTMTAKLNLMVEMSG
jgi:hypothetical protein